MLRILTGVFALVYLLVRLPVFLQLGDRRNGFDGVGLAMLLDGPVSGVVVDAVVVGTALAGIGFVIGWRFRIVGPLFRSACWRSGRIEGRGASCCTSRT